MHSLIFIEADDSSRFEIKKDLVVSWQIEVPDCADLWLPSLSASNLMGSILIVLLSLSAISSSALGLLVRNKWVWCVEPPSSPDQVTARDDVPCGLPVSWTLMVESHLIRVVPESAAWQCDSVRDGNEAIVVICGDLYYHQRWND